MSNTTETAKEQMRDFANGDFNGIKKFIDSQMESIVKTVEQLRNGSPVITIARKMEEAPIDGTVRPVTLTASHSVIVQFGDEESAEVYYKALTKKQF